MAEKPTVSLYLKDGLRGDVKAGRHNFFGILITAFAGQGVEVHLRPDTEEERLQSERRDEYSLFHLENPFHNRALDVRLAYMYPFWRFERGNWRENYEVSKLAFDQSEVDQTDAQQFFGYWRKQALSKMGECSSHENYVLVALQGRLDMQRRGQNVSPLEMIRETLVQEQFRNVVIKLHPKQVYSDAEYAALGELEKDPRVSFAVGDINALLESCDYVVTENSSVAFKALLHTKPSILFGTADFHHVFENVNDVGAVQAFRNILSKRIAYAKYFYWFLQLNMVNAGREGAGDRILHLCRHHGWDV